MQHFCDRPFFLLKKNNYIHKLLPVCMKNDHYLRNIAHPGHWYLSGSVQETSYSFETPTHDREFHLIVRYMVPGQIIPLQNRTRQYSPNIYQNRPQFKGSTLTITPPMQLIFPQRYTKYERYLYIKIYKL